MERGHPENGLLVVVVSAVLISLLGFPLISQAGLTLKADEMCTPVIMSCPCMTVPCKGGCCGGMNMHLCPCWDDPPSGRVSGICVASINCKGQTFTNQQGQTEGLGDLAKFLEMLKGKGGGGGGSGTTTFPYDEQQCTAYYQVTTPSEDPCAIYVPPVFDSLMQGGTGTGAASNLLETLGAPAYTASIDFSIPIGTTTSVSPAARPHLQGVEAGGGVRRLDALPRADGLSPEKEGDIIEGETGATIFARVRDVERNFEEAGFFGIDALFGAVQGAVANMCRSRPWDGSFVSYLIPSSFFDGLCTWRGYEVGVLPPAAEAPPAPVRKKSAPPAASSPIAPTTAPKIDIWAVPERVPLGARTLIFWNTKDVESCSITSPDGSFNENTLSGGAATVPLSGATTFTISCLTAGGKPVTDFVTVNLSI